MAGHPVDRAARIAFARNRVAGRTPEGVEYRFHCPDAAKFPAQFLWDSCWHAIALRHLDPAAARDELRTLMRAQEPAAVQRLRLGARGAVVARRPGLRARGDRGARGAARVARPRARPRRLGPDRAHLPRRVRPRRLAEVRRADGLARLGVPGLRLAHPRAAARWLPARR